MEEDATLSLVAPGSFVLFFGFTGTSATYQVVGWSYPEENETWTLGGESSLLLPRPDEPADYLIEMRIRPLLTAGVKAQRLQVAVNGTCVGNFLVKDAGTKDFWIPWSLIKNTELIEFKFSHPDFDRPETTSGKDADTRQLAIAFEALRMSRLIKSKLQNEAPASPGKNPIRSNLDAETVRLAFLDLESLGYHCELGLVQRHFGAEPLGLLRFGYSPIESVINAVASSFVGLGALDFIELRVQPSTREYMILDRCYGFEFHTWNHEGQVSPDRLLRQWQGRLSFLRRKLLESLSTGEKLTVITGEEDLENDGRIFRLRDTLHQHGPNYVLWVVPADGTHQAGQVEVVAPNILKGWLSHLAPREHAGSAEYDEWAHLALEAHAQWRRLVDTPERATALT